MMNASTQLASRTLAGCVSAGFPVPLPSVLASTGSFPAAAAASGSPGCWPASEPGRRSIATVASTMRACRSPCKDSRCCRVTGGPLQNPAQQLCASALSSHADCTGLNKLGCWPAPEPDGRSIATVASTMRACRSPCSDSRCCRVTGGPLQNPAQQLFASALSSHADCTGLNKLGCWPAPEPDGRSIATVASTMRACRSPCSDSRCCRVTGGPLQNPAPKLCV